MRLANRRVYGRGWCSVSGPNGEPILREVPPSAAPAASPTEDRSTAASPPPRATSPEAQWREEAVRRESARAERKAQEAKTAEAVALTERAVQRGAGAATPKRSEGSLAAGVVEPGLSASRPRDRWGGEESQEQAGETAAAARPSARRVGGWRAEALRREKAMFGRGRRPRPRSQAKDPQASPRRQQGQEEGEDWRPRVNRALALAEAVSPGSTSPARRAPQPEPVSPATTSVCFEHSS